jgi:hypothetical protein
MHDRSPTLASWRRGVVFAPRASECSSDLEEAAIM